jgi:uncharacterized protein YdeI (YjbR/CyaY-like superfamily)
MARRWKSRQRPSQLPSRSPQSTRVRAAGGRAQVHVAQADGRWAAAYEPQRTATTPDDLAAALAGKPRARAAYEALGRSERYAVFLPLLKARTPAGRARALRRAVAALEALGTAAQ